MGVGGADFILSVKFDFKAVSSALLREKKTRFHFRLEDKEMSNKNVQHV